MREILFRGKRVDNGEWIEGNYEWYHKPPKHIISNPYTGETKGVISETVGQYTGLTDKNGTKVFEGDICKTYFESYTRSWEEVGVFTEFCGAYGIESADGKHFRAFINESVYTRSREVIGNVHDNPELLENKE